MRIKIVRQINSRWSDGRVLSAMDGTERTIDDADSDMVAHVRHLAGLGDVQILDDAEEAEAPAQAPAEGPGEDDGQAKTAKAGARPRKAAAGAPEAAE